jgi:D-xylose transport system permease protein
MSNQVTSLASGHEGTLRDQFNQYVQRLKGGEMGSLPAIGATVVLAIIFGFSSPFFFTKLNFTNMFVQAAELTMLSSALVFVILLAEIDLAAGVTAGVSMAVFIVLIKTLAWFWVPALIVGFLTGLLIGWVIGFIVAKIGVPSFVVTLAFFLGFQGMQLVLLGEGGVYRIEVPEILAIMNNNLSAGAGWLMIAVCAIVMLALGYWDRGRRARSGLVNRPIAILYIKVAALLLIGGFAVWFMNLDRSQGVIPIMGVPIVVPFTIAILFIGSFVLDRTKFGRHLYAVGGNPEAARRAGIKVARIRIYAFMICAFLAVISGVFHSSRIGNVDGSAGHTIVLSGVAAAVVGGVSLFGGRGKLAHAAIGALVITMIDNGLGLLQMSAGVNFLVEGGVLLFAATLDALARKRSGGPLAR